MSTQLASWAPTKLTITFGVSKPHRVALDKLRAVWIRQLRLGDALMNDDVSGP